MLSLHKDNETLVRKLCEVLSPMAREWEVTRVSINKDKLARYLNRYRNGSKAQSNQAIQRHRSEQAFLRMQIKATLYLKKHGFL